MTLIMFLDERGGMLFNNRRQTLDYELLDIISKDFGERLYISPFSEKYFSGRCASLLEDPLADAPDDSAVFIEDRDVLPFIDRIDKILIYRWSKVYPSDRQTDILPADHGFRLLGKLKFSTEVHKDIVKEIYKR